MTKPESFTDEGFQFAWDATSLSNYMKCPRYYQFVNLLGWQPVNKSHHLLFGGWYASALENYYKYKIAGADHEDALRRVVREALLATWDVEDEPGPWISPDDKKSRNNLIRTIVWYLEEYEASPDPDTHMAVHVLDNGKPAVELSFSFEFSEDYLWCGHIDRVVSTPEGLYVADQKTTGSALSAYYFKQFELDVQMSGYTAAAQTMWTLPVKGVVIDAVQLGVGFSRFGRAMVPRGEAQLAEFHETALDYMNAAKQNVLDNKFSPNYASCNNYGGCAFREVCKRPPSLRQNFLRADFTQQPRWDPLQKR